MISLPHASSVRGTRGAARCDVWRRAITPQREGPSRRSAKGAGVGRRARAERRDKRETLVPARQRSPQFPLRPYTPLGPAPDSTPEWLCTGLTKSPSAGFHLLLEVPVHVQDEVHRAARARQDI